jgi:hypothetical protein
VDVAATIPTPVDPAFGPCRAYVESRDGAWRAVFALDGGRRGQSAGPAFPFDRAGGRAARALASVLNSRLASAEAPDPAVPTLTASAATSACVRCGRALPPGSRRQRRTCSDACRQAVRYRRATEGASADGNGRASFLTVSPAPQADPDSTDPTPEVGPDVARSARALPQRPDPARDPASRAHPLSLGLLAEG